MHNCPLEYVAALDPGDPGDLSVSRAENDLVEQLCLLSAVPRHGKLPLLIVGGSNDPLHAGSELYVVVQTEMGGVGMDVVERFLRVHVDRRICEAVPDEGSDFGLALGRGISPQAQGGGGIRGGLLYALPSGTGKSVKLFYSLTGLLRITVHFIVTRNLFQQNSPCTCSHSPK